MRNISSIIVASFMLISCSNSGANEDLSEDETADLGLVENESVEVSDSSEITCPECQYSELIELPTEYCLLAHDCSKCGYTMHPEGEDCCVFCTHGTHKCPSMQE